MKRNRKYTTFLAFRFLVGVGVAILLIYGWGRFTGAGSTGAMRLRARATPVARPGLIHGARVGWDGSRFLRRNSGFEKYSPDGGRQWSVALNGEAGRPDISPNAFHPSPAGDLLVLGLEGERDPTMVLVSISTDGQQIDRVARYPEMEPIDMSVDDDGRVYLYALGTHALNGLLCGKTRGPIQVEEDQLHELGPDGAIVRSFHPLRGVVHNADEAGRLIDRAYDYRLSVNSAGQLALYGQTGHDLIRVDPGTGRSAVTHLPQAGFPHASRIQDLRFTDTDQVVYSLVELDDDAALIGCQAWQMNLETGESRLLARRQGNEEAYTVEWDPLHRQLVVFDILGTGEKGVRALDLPDLRATRVDPRDDLFAFGERLQ